MNCGAKVKSYNYKLIQYIEHDLNKAWSPEQIASKLHLYYKDDKSMKIGFKTIYIQIYKNIIVKGDVKKLRRKGKSLKQKETRGKFNIDKSIKIDQKILGKEKVQDIENQILLYLVKENQKLVYPTFVERKSRYLVTQVIDNRKSTTFNLHYFKAFESISNKLIKTFTVDRDKEFAGYNEIEKTLNVNVYFADPYASWQRGSN